MRFLRHGADGEEGGDGDADVGVVLVGGVVDIDNLRADGGEDGGEVLLEGKAGRAFHR